MSTRGIAVLSGSSAVVAKILEDGTISFGQDKEVVMSVSGNMFVTGGIEADTIVANNFVGPMNNFILNTPDKTILFTKPAISGGENLTFTGSTQLIYDYNTNILSGTAAEFTVITGSSIAGNLAQFSTITGSDILVSQLTASLISSSNIFSNRAVIDIVTGSFLTSSNIVATTITGHIIYAEHFTGSHAHLDYIDFNGFPGEAPWRTGRLYYNTASNLLSVYTEYPNTHIHIGQQTVAKVQNDLGITLTKGKVVYITGSTSSDVPRVVTASWENDTYSARTLGLVMADILSGERGYAILEGLLEGLNTDNFLPGQLVYLSSSGNITNIQPPAPFHEVRLGEVVRKQNNNGSIFVRIQNGYELSELHDVEIPNPQNGDILTYSTSSFNQWINSKTLNGSYIITNDLTASSISASNKVSTQNITILGTASLSTIVNQATINFNSSSNRVEILPGLFVKGNIETTASISASSAQFGIISASIYQGLPELYRIVTTTSVVLDSTQCSVFAKNTVSNLVNITLPNAAAAKAKEYYFIKADSISGSIKILPSGSNLINGTGSFELNGPYQSVTLITDGSDWYIF